MELLGKYTLFAEGARGSLTQAVDREILARRQERAAEIRHRPEGSLGDRSRQAPEGPDPAFVRLAARTIRPAAARSSITTTTTRWRSVSSCISTTTIRICRRSTNSSASRPIPSIRTVFEGGKRLSYGARAITEGGYQSVPRLSFPGGALIGCAAGFVNVPRIKGVHNAMGSGMLAAEHVAAALGAGRANDELVEYENAWRDSAVGKDLHRVRNVKPLWSKFGTIIGVALGGFDMWCNTLGFSLFGTQSHAKPDRKTLDAAKDAHADRLPEAGRQDHLRQAVVGVPLQHQPRRGPAGSSQGRRHEPAEDVRARRLCRSVEPLLPGRGLRVGRGGVQVRASRSTPRTASTAKPATSRTRTATSPGFRRRAAAGPITRACSGAPTTIA